MPSGRIAILGATSTIGRAIAAEYARTGQNLLLCGRSLGEVERVAQDLSLRYGVAAEACLLDPDLPDYPQVLWRLEGGRPLGGVVWAIGTMSAAAGGGGPDEIRASTWVNFGAAVAAIEGLLPAVDPKGFIVLLSSVAGERGRRKNYVYGAAKAALTTYGQGLNHRLAGRGPRVTVVQLGVVDSQMTWGMSGGPAGADPEQVARAIVQAVRAGKGRVHVPAVWGPIMFLLRLVPESVFNRLQV